MRSAHCGFVFAALAVVAACDSGEPRPKPGGPAPHPNQSDAAVPDGSTALDASNNTVAAPRLRTTSSKTAYDAGEAIEIDVEITNLTSGALGLSDEVAGNLTLDTITLDGLPVEPRQSTIKFDDDLGAILEASLRTIEPRSAVELIWRSANDRVLQGQAIRTVEYQPAEPHIARIYPLGAPGTYELTLHYRFPADLTTQGTAFGDAVGPARVSFEVRAP